MAAKKSFAGQSNPALAYITQTPAAPEAPRPQQEAAQPLTGQQEASSAQTYAANVPQGFKALYVETKSRRIQLLMQPSLHEAIKARAAERGISVNEYIHVTLSEAVKEG